MTQKTKEIQITPRIGENDYRTKLKHAIIFIGKGDKVKIVLTLRGREYFTHKEHSETLLKRFCEDLKEITAIESMPKDKGVQQKKIIVILRPK